MSIIWTKDDEVGVEALKEVISENGMFVPKNGKNMVIKFDVIDYLKANHFLLEIAPLHDKEKREKIVEITGIEVTEVGYSSDKSKIDRAMELIKEAERILKGE